MSEDARTARRRVAFYAPMKSPNHPTPSGDRRIAQLTMAALTAAGFDPVVVSEFRSLEMHGDIASQQALIAGAETERLRVQQCLQASPPALWFTYHCYYKAPDLLGPELSRTFGVPYAISEPSISPKRRDGAWADFAARSEAAISSADHLFWTTHRDKPALVDAGHGAKMTHLPAFIEVPVTQPKRQKPRAPLRLLTIAMMRPGDKTESYRRLAEALPHISCDWHLAVIGDGSARAEVEALFADHSNQIQMLGQIDCPDRLAHEMDKADVFVWPGVGEGVGMVYIEAQAAGLPVVAEAHAAVTEVVAGACTPANDPRAYAARISQLADPAVYCEATTAAQDHIHAKHTLGVAAEILRTQLGALLQ